MMTSPILERTAYQVLEDVEAALLRPTGDIAQWKEENPGSAPPPAEFGRCIEYYTAVNAQHYKRYYELLNRVRDVVYEAINGFPVNQGATVGIPIATWAANHGSDAESVERVLRTARKYLRVN
ncbi:hypothetical protein GJ25_gp089 [Mycobacterium phage Hawkeye]|uniref:Uncharacterized protein n=1 Tax=Mycobacterium phage Hawkeye TaxID=1458711 RepID=X2KT58_9CAUD|nr:hypothetical protein GJ25_gp089 [Mycobacterium phage Hawkeye]AHN84100.1 hypothetical protein PBI_HAWKEYE_89 [Mycobacterium phage Hawkeye]